MKYKILLIIPILFLAHCTQNFSTSKEVKPYSSKGFAYIYNESDYLNKIISKKLENDLLQIAHKKLRPGVLIKITNPKTKDAIILKNSKKLNYPDFYKILLTDAVAKKLKLSNHRPYVELIEIKKNKSFIAAEAKIYIEEKKIYSNAPVELVKIDNISKDVKVTKKKSNEKIFIIIAEFYSRDTAILLKDRITNELKNYNSKKLKIRNQKTNKITLLSGPYNSINLVKNDYIQLKNYGFEELDIIIND